MLYKGGPFRYALPMPASFNVQPLSRSDVGGMAMHNFRMGEIPDHVDQARSHLNRVLLGRSDVPGALGPLPKVQPDTGRKIRKDARLGAAVVCTLPKEIDADDDSLVRQWADRTMDWLVKDCPGKVAYAVLHLDEGRPHIQGVVLPVDEKGHFSYKAYFGSPEKLGKLYQGYSRKLDNLGVVENSPALKELLAGDYFKGKDGWKAGKALKLAIEEVTVRSNLVKQREDAVLVPEVGSWRPPRRKKPELLGLLTEADEDYDKRLRASLARELQHRQQIIQVEVTRKATRASSRAYYEEKNARKELEEKCKPYLEAIKGLPGRLVTAFNGFLESVRQHVQKEDRESAKDTGKER